MSPMEWAFAAFVALLVFAVIGIYVVAAWAWHRLDQRMRRRK